MIEVQCVVLVVFGLDCLSEAKVIMPFLQCIEVDLFIVLDE